MSTYITKFNLSDTAYFVNDKTLDICSFGVREIFIKHSLSNSTPYILYRGMLNNNSIELDESKVLYLSEAQAAVQILISQRVNKITNMG